MEQVELGSNPSSNHPPLPPTSEDTQFDRLRLLRSHRVGISTYNRLIAEHGSAQAALLALPEVARAAGAQAYKICPAEYIDAELRAGKKAGAQLVQSGSPDYPSSLYDLTDAPPFIWALGDLSLLQKPCISIVGARNASSLGLRMAASLARDLSAHGYVIASGLARGIDAAAHDAALPLGTIAVQAGGVDVIYPRENTDLAKSVAKQGLRISEMPMGFRPLARHFPKRNRLISGLGQATVVIEAAAKSGSLITARDALDQGRDVYAVPGHPFDARSAGCNMLIRDGAVLIRNCDDILEALTPIYTSKSPQDTSHETAQVRPETLGPEDISARILSLLGPSPTSEDELIRDLGISPAQVAPALLDLELKSQITRQRGGLLIRMK